MPLLVFLCVGSSFLSAAHQVEHQLDSLNRLLAGADDTTRVLVHLEIAKRKAVKHREESVALIKKSIAEAKHINYLNGLVEAYTLMADIHTLLLYDFTAARLCLDSAFVFERRVGVVAQRALHQSAGSYYMQTGQIHDAYASYYKALRLADQRTDAKTANLYNSLGQIAHRLRKHEEAKRHLKKAVAIAEKIGRWGLTGSAYSNLAATYGAQKQYDSALYYYRILHQLETNHGNPRDNVFLLLGLGTAYHQLGQSDSAYRYLQKARAAAYRVGIMEGVDGVNLALADYYKSNHTDSAIYFGRKALRAHNQPLHAREQAAHILAQAFNTHKRFDSAYHYLQLYTSLHDSSVNTERIRQVAELEAGYQIERKEAAIRNLESEKELHEARQRILVVTEVGTVLVLAGLFLYYQLLIRGKRKNLAHAHHQLNDHIERLKEKSARVEELKTQLENIRKGNAHEGPLENLERVVQSTILTDDDWLEFKSAFEKVHRGFFKDLTGKFPDLTNAEIRLSALLKLKLSTREIAAILGISPDSVSKTRHRLRKKLNLPAEEDLDEFITNVHVRHT